MNKTYHIWTPYPSVTCLIGKPVLLALNIPLCIISCICNTLVLYVLMYRANFADRLILSLTIADLLTSYISQPMLIIVYIYDMINSSSESGTPFLLQRIAFLLNGTTCAASVMSIGFIVMARYTQIKRPLRYHFMFTNKRLVIICVYTWICAIAFTILPLTTGMSFYVYYACVISCIAIEAVMIVCINISIMAIARRIVHCSERPTPPSKKAFKTIIIISVAFIASTVPFGIVGTAYFAQWPAMSLTYTPTYYCNDMQRNACGSIYFYALLLYHTTSISNPLMYTLRDTKIKSPLKRLLLEKFPMIFSGLEQEHNSHDHQLRVLNTRVSRPSPSYGRSHSSVSTIGSRLSVSIFSAPYRPS